ncbi:DNA topology modulation protein [Mesobacillus jeotgali]|uniref:DNA topology modulation protein n=1 Tax=Mesobacillus jeotgali TaxID=129985 RepID=UPI0009A77A71|nr:DNA topology modulation protein [Mesobacillus jeotgali]
MEKVIIIGNGGAGKSTLARKLGKAINKKVYHLDALYWKPGWEMTAKDEWKAVLTEIMSEDSWIMDGNYGSTIEMRAEAADTIIFLDYSTARCLFGIVKRRIMYHGKSRPDMNEGCQEKLDWEFLKWVSEYRRKKAPVIIDLLEKFKFTGKETHHFTHPRDADKFIAEQLVKGGH